ncbi:uncharacterized protein LOC109605726 isoform X2 [Aethina tumida]|uniref:uncharacterized protein LOC109605726 isoform X2 n=1 Tax=Aethina tumida TaxID=116153 RepID=UPI002147EAB0|nr:uncharacterized protein LOC109605726 isoform X2 [Aethina tumida]
MNHKHRSLYGDVPVFIHEQEKNAITEEIPDENWSKFTKKFKKFKKPARTTEVTTLKHEKTKRTLLRRDDNGAEWRNFRWPGKRRRKKKGSTTIVNKNEETTEGKTTNQEFISKVSNKIYSHSEEPTTTVLETSKHIESTAVPNEGLTLRSNNTENQNTFINRTLINIKYKTNKTNYLENISSERKYKLEKETTTTHKVTLEEVSLSEGGINEETEGKSTETVLMEEETTEEREEKEYNEMISSKEELTTAATENEEDFESTTQKTENTEELEEITEGVVETELNSGSEQEVNAQKTETTEELEEVTESVEETGLNSESEQEVNTETTEETSTVIEEEEEETTLNEEYTEIKGKGNIEQHYEDVTTASNVETKLLKKTINETLTTNMTIISKWTTGSENTISENTEIWNTVTLRPLTHFINEWTTKSPLNYEIPTPPVPIIEVSVYLTEINKPILSQMDWNGEGTEKQLIFLNEFSEPSEDYESIIDNELSILTDNNYSEMTTMEADPLVDYIMNNIKNDGALQSNIRDSNLITSADFDTISFESETKKDRPTFGFGEDFSDKIEEVSIKNPEVPDTISFESETKKDRPTFDFGEDLSDKIEEVSIKNLVPDTISFESETKKDRPTFDFGEDLSDKIEEVSIKNLEVPDLNNDLNSNSELNEDYDLLSVSENMVLENIQSTNNIDFTLDEISNSQSTIYIEDLNTIKLNLLSNVLGTIDSLGTTEEVQTVINDLLKNDMMISKRATATEDIIDSSIETFNRITSEGGNGKETTEEYIEEKTDVIMKKKIHKNNRKLTYKQPKLINNKKIISKVEVSKYGTKFFEKSSPHVLYENSTEVGTYATNISEKNHNKEVNDISQVTEEMEDNDYEEIIVKTEETVMLQETEPSEENDNELFVKTEESNEMSTYEDNEDNYNIDVTPNQTDFYLIQLSTIQDEYSDFPTDESMPMIYVSETEPSDLNYGETAQEISSVDSPILFEASVETEQIITSRPIDILSESFTPVNIEDLDEFTEQFTVSFDEEDKAVMDEDMIEYTKDVPMEHTDENKIIINDPILSPSEDKENRLMKEDTINKVIEQFDCFVESNNESDLIVVSPITHISSRIHLSSASSPIFMYNTKKCAIPMITRDKTTTLNSISPSGSTQLVDTINVEDTDDMDDDMNDYVKYSLEGAMDLEQR